VFHFECSKVSTGCTRGRKITRQSYLKGKMMLGLGHIHFDVHICKPGIIKDKETVVVAVEVTEK
jgi:hypothetical protein